MKRLLVIGLAAVLLAACAASPVSSLSQPSHALRLVVGVPWLLVEAQGAQ
jgi:uncharacterized lipoprotein YajG